MNPQPPTDPFIQYYSNLQLRPSASNKYEVYYSAGQLLTGLSCCISTFIAMILISKSQNYSKILKVYLFGGMMNRFCWGLIQFYNMSCNWSDHCLNVKNYPFDGFLINQIISNLYTSITLGGILFYILATTHRCICTFLDEDYQKWTQILPWVQGILIGSICPVLALTLIYKDKEKDGTPLPDLIMPGFSYSPQAHFSINPLRDFQMMFSVLMGPIFPLNAISAICILANLAICKKSKLQYESRNSDGLSTDVIKISSMLAWIHSLNLLVYISVNGIPFIWQTDMTAAGPYVTLGAIPTILFTLEGLCIIYFTREPKRISLAKQGKIFMESNN